MTYGFLGSLGAGLSTGLGALPIFFLRNASPRLLDTLLGFSAGIMLGASFFSLIHPSIQLSNVWVASLGILLGGCFFGAANFFIPHIHTISGWRESERGQSKVWLFVLAITLHNFPEGLSVGVGFGKGEIAEGISLAVGIGFQNIPEGMAVAFALIREGYGRFFALGYAILTGLVEPMGGVLGAGVVTMTHSLLPWGLAFAGGAMLFVISNEVIPETHRRGHPIQATSGMLLGFIMMMLFDHLFT